MTSKVLIYKDDIIRAFLNGAKAVILKEKQLNEINVFPVRDADTGTNLRSMMDSILKRTQMKDTLKETLESISDAALIGSKGNSGLIFSQFIYGLSKDIHTDFMDQKVLIQQIRKGYEFAYEAIDMPVEGTIITLMRHWYNLLNQEAVDSSFEEYLLRSSIELQKSLEETKSLLPILKKSDVVDAGALAFSTFVDGFVRSITDENYIVEIEESEVLTLDHKDSFNHDEINIEFRYCTEILIKSKLQKESLQLLLEHHGNSIVIGKSNEFYKIHIHTNEPHKVFEYISKYATIVDSKVDDMENQNMINHHRKYDIAILTDSISDIHQSIIDAFQIQVFPVSINIDGTIYYDKKSIKNKRILELIESSNAFPKSASPSTIDVVKNLELLRKHFKQILVITVSSKMSSTYNIFKNAITELKTDDIKLIDSKQNSVGEGLITLHAAKMISEGYTFDEVYESTKEIVKKSNILVSVKTLDNMVRSGRVSKSLGLIAKVLNLKPIVSINQNGEGVVLSKALGRKNSFNKILKHMKKVHKKEGIISYAISYVDNIQEAEKFKSSLVRALGFMPEFVTESSAIIAMNAGKDAVAVGYIIGGK